MRIASGEIRLAATDVSNHLACHHLTNLQLSVARGERAEPEWQAPDLAVLREMGLRHEKSYLEFLVQGGSQVLNLAGIGGEARILGETILAMERGVEVIAQGALSSGRWFGRPDILRKVQKPSRFGSWSYEAYDCKLARETKATTLLQLAFYSELLGPVQGTDPECMYVVPTGKGFQPESYRVAEYAAYYRHVKERLEAACEEGEPTATYPEPCVHCDVCQWFRQCDARRRGDDHLSLVAGITRLQRKQLEDWKIETLAKLAVLPIPLKQNPLHGSRGGIERVREQARVQADGRTQGKPVHETLSPIVEGTGFFKLPEPTPGDVFVDLEGDPFAGDLETGGGHQYLFGFVAADERQSLSYHKRWAFTAEEEKRGFEWFVDEMTARLKQFPGMHVYHFGANEPSRFKHLMGRYATRQEEIDSMLRAGLFIDLHTVFKQALRASVEEYSVKKLEVFYQFERSTAMEKSKEAMRFVEHRLRLGWEGEELPAEFRAALEGYNSEDCLSTKAMRDWLEGERAKMVAGGVEIGRPGPVDSSPPENLKEWQQRVAVLVGELTQDVAADASLRSREQAARWLMAQLLDWHWRETKPSAWEFYRLAENDDEELLDERQALSGLTIDKRIAGGAKPIERYKYIKQETQVRAGKELWHREERVGTVVAIDLVDRTVDIEKVAKWAGVHPSSVFARDTYRRSDAQKESLYRLGCWIRDHGVDSPGPYKAARDLLLRNPPRMVGPKDGLAISVAEGFENGVCRIVRVLDNSVLPIQGPPGSGKTTTGAKIIHDLVAGKKKVGVSALSHEVIHYLLTKVITEPGGEKIRCLHKCEAGSYGDDGIATTGDNKVPLKQLGSSGVDVVGGTSWMWSRPEYANAVDVLVIDEAGQMSLADVLAMAQSAKSLVLIGDPQQLARPQKGSHPEGAEKSALEHLLADPRIGQLKTMPPQLGLFIPETKRLHPKTCEFTSQVFYEGQLTSLGFTANRVLEGHPWLRGAGLWFVPVEHEGNCNSSAEEVEVVARIVASLLAPNVRWFRGAGRSEKLKREKDILIVAPYNAQVSDLSERLRGMAVGTVDKFQGQEAAVVIYSLTTSTPEDAPRGMEFLYSLNRFNVATSRAMTAVIVVGSPRLFEPECKSPRQMQLANAFCAYLERATVVDLAGI